MIISIFGPTAVGKSRAAVEVAARLGGEIISADSMQVYKGLPILTDQPPQDLQIDVPHHLIGTVPLDEDYSAGRYVKEATEIIYSLQANNKIPVLVGGTGLYIRALLGGFSFAGMGDADVRKRWESFIEEEGNEAAWQELLDLDPDASEAVDRGNPRRLARALEVAETGGAMISEERDRLWSGISVYDARSFGIDRAREELYECINQRVEHMLQAGAIEEVNKARQGVISRTAAQTIGLREIGDYLNGKITIDETSTAIKQRSRRYAKRQLTWMRKMSDIARIDTTGRSPAEAANIIIKRVQSNP